MSDNPCCKVTNVNLLGIHQFSQKVDQFPLDQLFSQPLHLGYIVEETEYFGLDRVLAGEGREDGEEQVEAAEPQKHLN